MFNLFFKVDFFWAGSLLDWWMTFAQFTTFPEPPLFSKTAMFVLSCKNFSLDIHRVLKRTYNCNCWKTTSMSCSIFYVSVVNDQKYTYRLFLSNVPACDCEISENLLLILLSIVSLCDCEYTSKECHFITGISTLF